ncbi:MAG: nitroreductase/quinone reductase family protein [Nitrososphaerales archaeon]
MHGAHVGQLQSSLRATTEVLKYGRVLPGLGMDASSPEWYDKATRLRISTVGRTSGKQHEVIVDFVSEEGSMYITGVRNNRDWIKNILRNSDVEVTIKDIAKKMVANLVQSEEKRASVQKLYKKKYPIISRLVRLAGPGKRVFELTLK